jgi:hypothetical protein
MHSTFTQSSIATTTDDCDRYKATIVSEELELEANDVLVPVDYRSIEVFAINEQSAHGVATALFVGYKVMDCWQSIEQDCPF